MPLNALRAFEGVARHGSFTGAAHALNVSQSSLSQHVIALERLIGVALFERGPQGLALTRAGEHMLAAVATSLGRLEYALDEIRSESAPVKRTLRLQMPLSIALHLALPIIRELRLSNAELDIDLASPSSTGPPLRDPDVMLMYAPAPRGRLAAEMLWPLRLRILCHPRLAQLHRGAGLADFIQANELVHVRDDRMSGQESWAAFLQRNGLCGLTAKRGLVLDSSALAARYVSSGEGIMLGDAQLFRGQMRRGGLVSPFAAELDTGCACCLVTHPAGRSDWAVAQLRACLLNRLAQEADGH